MKNNILAFAVLSFLIASPAFAANNPSAGSANQVAPAKPTVAPASPVSSPRTSASPAGNQVNNQVQTKNMGEETELKVQTSTALNSLMSMPEQTGGVGSEAKEVAVAQKESQSALDVQLSKLESRSSLMTKLFGADRQALKELKQIKEQNQVRIQTLEQLKTKTMNKGELDQLQLAIDAMVQQNTELSDQIGTAESTPSLFGWMFRLFKLQ